VTNIRRVLSHDALKCIYGYSPCIKNQKEEKILSGFSGYEGLGWGGIIPYSVKYKSTVDSYNIFPSHKADDVFYYQQSSVHV
jgi:hypothetical protein